MPREGLTAAQGHRRDLNHRELFARQPGRVSKGMEVWDDAKHQGNARKSVWHKLRLVLGKGDKGRGM